VLRGWLPSEGQAETFSHSLTCFGHAMLPFRVALSVHNKQAAMFGKVFNHLLRHFVSQQKASSAPQGDAGDCGPRIPIIVVRMPSHVVAAVLVVINEHSVIFDTCFISHSLKDVL